MAESDDRDEFYFTDIKVSGGPIIVQNSVVLLLYKVALSQNGLISSKLIESTYSPDIPITVTMNTETLLEGVYRGLLGMRGGGSVRRIVIPPSMGYGERGYGAIPPNAMLFVEACTVAVDNNMS